MNKNIKSEVEEKTKDNLYKVIKTQFIIYLKLSL